MNFSTVEDLKSTLESKPDGVQFIDVRTPGEFQRGHIEGFVNIPLDSEPEAWSKLDRNAPTYVICLSGGRSQMACGTLEAMGFRDLRNVQGGMLTWRATLFANDV